MIRNFLYLILGFSGILACQEKDPSRPQAIFNASDIRLMDPQAHQKDAQAQSVGALLEVIDIDGAIVTKAFCTAIKISSRHILSAAHCERVRGRIVFEPYYLAADNAASNLEYLSLGSSVRLLFRGELHAQALKHNWQNLPDLDRPLYANPELDYAVFDLGYSLDGPSIKLERSSFDVSHLRLYGFQNGTPLTVTDGCAGVNFYGVLRHDCDALTGVSGGLIVDAGQRPIALHTFSSVVNAGGPEVSRRQFEDLAALKTRATAIVKAKTPEEANRVFWECRHLIDLDNRVTCQIGNGLNRALFLSTIRNDLEINARPLYDIILRSQDSHVSDSKPSIDTQAKF